MQQLTHNLPQDWRIAAPIVVFVLCLGLGLVFRNLLLAGLQRWAAVSDRHIGAVIADGIRTPLVLWALILGADLATRSSQIPAAYVHRIDMILLALWIISLTMIAAQVAGNAVAFYGAHVSGQAAATATLSRNLAQILAYTLGIMILLNHLGVDIRPLLTALGVGGLAVALALQDTMANLFAGFYISVAGQIRLGDYVKLNTNEEGYVVDITWRSTTLKTLGNNLIFVPNSKLGQANVTNYHVPEKKMSSSITFRLAYGVDTAHAESLILDEAKAAKDIAGLVVEDPFYITWIPADRFGAVLSLNFNVTEFASQFGVQSELRRRIYRRMEREGCRSVRRQRLSGYCLGRRRAQARS